MAENKVFAWEKFEAQEVTVRRSDLMIRFEDASKPLTTRHCFASLFQPLVLRLLILQTPGAPIESKKHHTYIVLVHTFLPLLPTYASVGF